MGRRELKRMRWFNWQRTGPSFPTMGSMINVIQAALGPFETTSRAPHMRTWVFLSQSRGREHVVAPHPGEAWMAQGWRWLGPASERRSRIEEQVG